MTDEETAAWETIAAYWKPVKDWADKRVDDIEARLAARESTAGMEDVRYLQGQIEALRGFVRLPQQRLKEQQKQHARRNRRD